MSKQQRPLISFDWAIKKILRQKPNYVVLEGFLSVLLNQDLTINNILESESNSENAADKINKVDILCETSTKEVVLIELQYNSESDYFHRMLYGASKIITDFYE
jgi:predicted transposase/invertase (TIGR01784 family)